MKKKDANLIPTPPVSTKVTANLCPTPPVQRKAGKPLNFFLRNLPEDLWAEAKVVCHNEGVSLRTWIITLVQREVKAAKKKGQ